MYIYIVSDWLPYPKHGNPLNGSLETVDLDLELRNFASAAKDLCYVANRETISGRRVHARYDPPEDSRNRQIRILSQMFKVWSTAAIFEQFLWQHFSQSQYHGQLTKCEQRYGPCSFCKPVRSSYFDFIRHSNNYPAIPTCVAVEFKEGRQCMSDPTKKQTKHTPFANLMQTLNMKLPRKMCQDTFNPRISAEDIEKRTCPTCRTYFCSVSAKDRHRKYKVHCP